MNKKIIYSTATILLLACGFTACSSDNNGDEIVDTTAPQTAKIELDAATIEVGVGEKAVMNIKNGGGDYRVFSEDTAAVAVSLEGQAINIETKKKGLVGVVLSDKAGNYKRFVVKSMYMKLATDVEEINIAMKLGSKDGRATFNITEGNGGYEAESDNNDIATVGRLKDGQFLVYGKKEGTVNITVTDMMGLKKTIKATIAVSKIPFTDEEKNTVLALDNTILVWKGVKFKGSYYKVKAEPNLISSSYSDKYFIKFNFEGDLSVGKKLKGNVEYTEYYNAPVQKTEEVEIEILKVEGKSIWGIASKVEETTMHTGYFCIIGTE